jgi:ATP-dependent RNA circularization protein (DNA/RNA ligase family)
MTEPEATAFLNGEITVEEKVDGANIGISIGTEGGIRVQNRGQYLGRPYSGQFGGLNQWLASREDSLFDFLGEERILFGEWCEARHSLAYDRLPDWFLAFDVYEVVAGSFWSTRRRDTLPRELRLSFVPFIVVGRFTLTELTARVGKEKSRYREGPLEGLYLRQDHGDVLSARAKIVRPEFAQSIGEHWTRRRLERNSVLLKSTSA